MKTVSTPHHIRIRIIIPAYRDREAVSKSVHHLLSQGWQPRELCVVLTEDDETASDMSTLGIPYQLLSPDKKGRARQMNAGAKAGDADLLVFLHADTRLPDSARNSLEQAYREDVVGGGFSRRFDSPSLFLRITCRLADLRGRFFGWYFGDQTLWCRKECFDQLHGFPDRPLFEDLDFSRRLHTLGPTRLLPGPSLSSARRFEIDGPLLRTWKDLKLTLQYLRTTHSDRIP
jgi:glycosyltransferase involved in cell wall biosynthesis